MSHKQSMHILLTIQSYVYHAITFYFRRQGQPEWTIAHTHTYIVHFNIHTCTHRCECAHTQMCVHNVHVHTQTQQTHKHALSLLSYCSEWFLFSSNVVEHPLQLPRRTFEQLMTQDELCVCVCVCVCVYVCTCVIACG